jgi:hypothetical protein
MYVKEAKAILKKAGYKITESVDGSTLSLQDLIKALQEVREHAMKQKIDPNSIEVYLSRDEEGNGYSTIDVRSLDFQDGKLCIYPWEEGVQLF